MPKRIQVRSELVRVSDQYGLVGTEDMISILGPAKRSFMAHASYRASVREPRGSFSLADEQLPTRQGVATRRSFGGFPAPLFVGAPGAVSALNASARARKGFEVNGVGLSKSSRRR